jgi:hypothetical protein
MDAVPSLLTTLSKRVIGLKTFTAEAKDAAGSITDVVREAIEERA